MSFSKDKGNAYEMKIAGIIRKKTKLRAVRDTRSGAAWHRRSDISTDLPGVHIECKAHETIKVKEFFRQADDGASFTQKPIVVFPMDDDDLTIMRFTDVLDLVVEIADLKAEVEDLQHPINDVQTVTSMIIPANIDTDTNPAESIEYVQKLKYCRTGHIAGDDGKCMVKGCPHMRGAKVKKKKE